MRIECKHFCRLSLVTLVLAAIPAFAQITPQLSEEQLTRELSCAGGTVSNGECSIQTDPNSLQALCEKDGNHVWQNNDCLENRGATQGFNTGQRAGPAQTQRSVAPESARSGATAATLRREVAANLLLVFDLDSANLTDQAIANARVFARVVNSPEFQQARFEIQGHTDMRGAREYNQDLSRRRAEAVKAFLVSQGIAADRLAARGYSYDQLADPMRPQAPENRRVVARRLN